jgi:pyruvate-formate lyase-activating enzyme
LSFVTEFANCRHLPALFVDVDFKVVPEDEARARLARARHPASAIIASGGGLHVYFRLPVPIDLRTDADRAKRLLRRLADELGGDRAAAEPARILRLPRTVNHKYRPPRPVVLECLDA